MKCLNAEANILTKPYIEKMLAKMDFHSGFPPFSVKKNGHFWCPLSPCYEVDKLEFSIAKYFSFLMYL